MVLEIATLDIKPGQEKAFEAGVADAVKHFKAAPGCHGMALQRSHETPSRYLLFVRWDSVEAHTVDFRNGPHFAGWRSCVSDFFAAPPSVEHVHQVLEGF